MKTSIQHAGLGAKHFFIATLSASCMLRAAACRRLGSTCGGRIQLLRGGLSVRMFNQERSSSSDQVEVRLTSGEAQHSVVRRPIFAPATACVSMSGLWLVGGDGAVAAELCGLLLLPLTRPL